MRVPCPKEANQPTIEKQPQNYALKSPSPQHDRELTEDSKYRRTVSQKQRRNGTVIIRYAKSLSGNTLRS